MRLLVLSDLHLEVWGEDALRFDLAASRPDAVLLAGDIHAGAHAPGWAAARFPGLPVLYVSGNHEMYGGAVDETDRAIGEACARHPNVRYLNRDEVVIGDVRFLGCTLWTDFRLFGAGRRDACLNEARAVMNDYRRIKVRIADDGFLDPTDTIRLHEQQKAWLRKKLLQPFSGRTVVLTHMAPSKTSIVAPYENASSSAAFASNLDDLAAMADVWIHGHTHDSLDYRIGKCQVVCNPLGYRMRNGAAENGGFDPNRVVLV
ncbi:Calcineurin-like phosphoesterase superfamily domain-containing protein [Noviherbaspirillum humi]|uniref:Calcineurin-like phosphoesterase superfamily domain-containing protein n=1 Tax=Noviherbaspirillum humi TaxID=1688639 RepID=A0A239JRK5_9BURK|nr:metallophosphoesterase family protein [Noviherbaspirillum humi]SNT08467.1 Calcineurin-like phosphoesterase superfamily domain-containing protein [Noviherbaspirillum humi]